MEEKKSYKAWTISDKFWEVIKGEIPKKGRNPGKEYKNSADWLPVEGTAS